MVGIAPWFSAEQGGQRVIRFLGSGQVCTDHLTILATPEYENAVVSALAEWLLNAGTRTDDRWDRIELECVSADDLRIRNLTRRLTDGGCRVASRDDIARWQIDLPDTWDEFIARFSKNRRKRLRRYERTCQSEQLRLRSICDQACLSDELDTLVDLHLKRRTELEGTSCFESRAFVEFLREVTPLLLDAGLLQLSVLEDTNRPLAIEYTLVGQEAIYLFQSGFDPDVAHLSPGNLVTVLLIQQSIATGRRRFDFLRGDETYKATWGAQRQRTVQIRIAANRMLPRVRQHMWLAGRSVKDLMKGFSDELSRRPGEQSTPSETTASS